MHIIQEIRKIRVYMERGKQKQFANLVAINDVSQTKVD